MLTEDQKRVLSEKEIAFTSGRNKTYEELDWIISRLADARLALEVERAKSAEMYATIEEVEAISNGMDDDKGIHEIVWKICEKYEPFEGEEKESHHDEKQISELRLALKEERGKVERLLTELKDSDAILEPFAAEYGSRIQNQCDANKQAIAEAEK